MIRSPEDYEAALERLIAMMEHPPRLGAEDSAAFAELLAEIERYTPRMTAPEAVGRAVSQDEAAALVRQANALLAEREAQARRQRYSSFPDDGEGIGPTTGI